MCGRLYNEVGLADVDDTIEVLSIKGVDRYMELKLEVPREVRTRVVQAVDLVIGGRTRDVVGRAGDVRVMKEYSSGDGPARELDTAKMDGDDCATSMDVPL